MITDGNAILTNMRHAIAAGRNQAQQGHFFVLITDWGILKGSRSTNGADLRAIGWSVGSGRLVFESTAVHQNAFGGKVETKIRLEVR